MSMEPTGGKCGSIVSYAYAFILKTISAYFHRSTTIHIDYQITSEYIYRCIIILLFAIRQNSLIQFGHSFINTNMYAITLMVTETDRNSHITCYQK